MAITIHSKNILYLFSGDVASRVIGFAATAYLARVLGIDNFGLINLGMAVLTYGLIVGNSGLNLLGTREIASNTEKSDLLVGRIFGTRLLLSTIVYLIAVFMVALFINSKETGEIILIYLLFLFPSALLLDWFFQGRNQMHAIAIGRFVAMLSYLIFVLIFVRNTNDTILTAWGWMIGGVANALFLWLVFKQNNYQLQFQWKNWKIRSLLNRSLPLGLSSLISQVVIQFPFIYLGWLATKSEVGLYGAAFRLNVLLLIFDRVFYTVFYPVISRCAQQTPDRLNEMVNRVLKIIVVAALSIGMLAFFSANFLITIVFGDDYLNAVPLFQILVGYFALTLTNSVIGFTLVGMSYEKAFTRSFVWGMVAFFIGIFLLPSLLDTAGVVSALILYQLIALISMAMTLKKKIAVNLSRYFLIPFLGTLLVILPGLLYLEWQWPFKLLLIIFVILPLLIIISGINFDDFQYIKKRFI